MRLRRAVDVELPARGAARPDDPCDGAVRQPRLRCIVGFVPRSGHAPTVVAALDRPRVPSAGSPGRVSVPTWTTGRGHSLDPPQRQQRDRLPGRSQAELRRRLAWAPWRHRPQRRPRRDRRRCADRRRRGDVRRHLERQHRLRRACGGCRVHARRGRPRRPVRGRGRRASVLSRSRELRPRAHGPRPRGAPRRDRRPARRAPRGGRRPPLRQAARRALPPVDRGSRRRPTPSPHAVAALSDAARPAAARPRSRTARSPAAAAGAGLPFVREAFLDRGYRADGSLVPRGEPGALLDDPDVVAARAVRLVREGVVDAADGTRDRGGRGIPLPPRRLARRRSRWPAPCALPSTATASRCARRGDRPRAADGGPRDPARGRRRSTTCSRCTRRSSGRGRRGRRHRARRADGARARRPPHPLARGGPRVGAVRLGRRRRRARRRPGDEVVLDIVYDGADLADTAALLGAVAGGARRAARRRRAGRWRSPGSRPASATSSSPDWPYDVPRLDVAAHAGARGVGRPRGRLHRRLPARDPGRLAADRHDAGAAVRSGCRVPGAPGTRAAASASARCAELVRAAATPLRDPRGGPAGSRSRPRPATVVAGAGARDPRGRARAARHAAGSGPAGSGIRRRLDLRSARPRPPCAPPTGWWATPKAPRSSRSRWAASGRRPTPTCGSR